MAHDVAEPTLIARPPWGREPVPVQLSRLLEAITVVGLWHPFGSSADVNLAVAFGAVAVAGALPLMALGDAHKGPR
jgi:hypothetical protein